jgi:hypothetical protein
MHELELSVAPDSGDHQEPLRTEPDDRRLHPQLALWMVRGVLGAFIGTATLALLSERMTRIPDPTTFHLAVVRSSETIAPPTSVVSSPEPALDLAAAPESAVREDPEPNDSIYIAPAPPTTHRVQRSTPRDTKAKTSRPANHYRQHRSIKRPFTTIARGARRTIRTVGRKLGRLL